MRILWFTYLPTRGFCNRIPDQVRPVSWIEASIDSLDTSMIDLGICCTADIPENVMFKADQISYYCLSMGNHIKYKRNKQANIQQWENVIKDFKPDIIQLWGTEFPIWLDVRKAAGEIPVVVVIQGVVSTIAQHYFGGLVISDILKGASLFNCLKTTILIRKKNDMESMAQFERQLLGQVNGIIADSHWCAAQYSDIHNLKFYVGVLPVQEPFFTTTWNLHEIERETIFCVASHYPLKGLHILIRALAIVKGRYPDVLLSIPGINMLADTSFRSKIRRSPYLSYILRLIKQFDLQDNIKFSGFLSAEEMAATMKKSHVFVMPSCIEHHSSTLREAMLIGVPSVSSYVGCVSEFVKHGENGFLYRFEDYHTLAQNIMRIFEDDELASELSINARESIREKYYHKNNWFFEIYETVIKNSQK